MLDGWLGDVRCSMAFHSQNPFLPFSRSIGDTLAHPSGKSASVAMAAARLPRFPEFGLLSVMKLLQLFPALAPAAGI